jgi:outer membrane protein OmpA-like peptidoglycan-associated protein
MRSFLLVLAMVAVAAANPTVTVKTGRLVTGEPIYFDFGKPVIKPASYAQLDAIAKTITGNLRLGVIEIGVHTDERGADDYNLRVSQERADAIRDYLVGKGVSANRLRAKGYGETRPIDKRHNEAAWSKNRRTEFLIVVTS